jgi:3-oxoacyl-[acyl-carrier-protein] synthase II
MSAIGGNRGDVFVTGVGAVTPLGCGRERFWSRLCAGESGIVPGQAPDGKGAAARLCEFAPRELISSSHLRRMDMPSRMIAGAARLALTDAGIDAGEVPAERVGIVVGSPFGDLNDTLDYLQRLFAKGPGLVSPMLFPSLVLNAAASYTAMEVSSTGTNFTVAQGEVSGDCAISLGCDLIRTGRAEVVLAGGGDELDRIVWSTFAKLHGLSPQRGGPESCSPYDVDRNGVLMGEGAAMLVLESPERARARQAVSYAAIEDEISFGIPSSLYGWPAEAGDAVGVLRSFLARVKQPDGNGVIPDAVFGSGNSSRRLDELEVSILSRLFGEAAAEVSLTSIKGATGEFCGAGALTAATAALSLHGQVLPPLANLRNPIASRLRFAGPTARPADLRRVLQLSVARGGAVSAMLFRRVDA